jgi:hypothetical protein
VATSATAVFVVMFDTGVSWLVVMIAAAQLLAVLAALLCTSNQDSL